MSSYRIFTAVPTRNREELPPVYIGEIVFTVQTKNDYGRNREININHNRYDLQQKCKGLENRYDLVLLMDSDVIVTEEALKKLVENFDGSPLCIKTKGGNWDDRHICCACCLMRYTDWQAIDYINSFVDDCQCMKIAELYPSVHYLEGVHGRETHEDYIITDKGNPPF